MSLVSLSLLKKHVMADDFATDDVLLQQKLDAAEEFTVFYINRSLSELTEMGGGSLPAPIVQAILVLAGDMYANREDSSSQNMRPIPNGFRPLVAKYRKLVNDYSNNVAPDYYHVEPTPAPVDDGSENSSGS